MIVSYGKQKRIGRVMLTVLATLMLYVLFYGITDIDGNGSHLWAAGLTIWCGLAVIAWQLASIGDRS